MQSIITPSAGLRELIKELVVHFTGTDDTAIAEWLYHKCIGVSRFHALGAHYGNADDSWKSAWASYYGITDHTKEPFPGPKGLENEYKRLYDYIDKTIGEV